MEKIIDVYNDIMSLKDPRVETWLFVKTPFIPLIILFVYIQILYIGKTMMKNREAFELRTFLYVYNFLQVVVSFYIFYELLATAILSKYSLVCQPVDYSDNPLSLRMARGLWLYYITKIIDLIDTIVFVLRKKSNQITFLHLFHHISMVLNAWSGVRFVPGGQTFFLAMLNSFVHTIMYAYYGLSALGPWVQKYLWWKKYITQMQLVQFGIVLLHTSINYFSKCTYPKGFDIAFMSYGIFIMILFLNFYRQSYLKSKREAAAKKASKDSTKTSNGTNGIGKKHN